MEDEGIRISLNHAQGLSGLLACLMAVLRHYQPSDELFDVLRTQMGAGGWGHLLAEGNPRGVWLLLEQATHLQGWLGAVGGGHFPEDCRPPTPPLPAVVAQSYENWRRGIYEA